MGAGGGGRSRKQLAAAAVPRQNGSGFVLGEVVWRSHALGAVQAAAHSWDAAGMLQMAAAAAPAHLRQLAQAAGEQAPQAPKGVPVVHLPSSGGQELAEGGGGL